MRATSWLAGVCELLFQAQARRRAASRRAGQPAQAELLETRQLLAAAITLTVGGWVKIDGTSQDDVATVEAVDADNIRIRVVTGAETVEQVFARTALTAHIDFDAMNGNDSLTDTTDLRVIMSGGDGNDTLLGGSGADTFVGGNGDDNFNGGVGNDQAFGGEGTDSLTGGGGHDLLKGENGNDTINADSGNDTVSGGEGTDSLNGGTGTDLITEQLSWNPSWVTYYVLAQNSASSTDSTKNFESASIIGSTASDRIDLSGFTFPATISGGAYPDTLIGGTAADLIYGEGDNDTLVGGIGNDTLVGGANSDWMTGGAGDDVINGGAGSNTFEEFADANLTLTASGLTGIGNDRLSGIYYVHLVGGAGNNRLDASGFTGGYVTLDGGAGDDVLIGSPSNDALIGGLGSDTIDGGGSRDALGEFGDNLEIIGGTLYEYGAINVSNSHTNVEDFRLFGSTANSKLKATGLSNSGVTLSGGDGDDTLTAVNNANSTVRLVGGKGVDWMVSNFTGAGLSWMNNNGFFTENVSISLADIERADLTGDNGPNGFSGDDFTGSVLVRGLGGDDTLKGAAGNDTLVGGEGNDSLNGGIGGYDRGVATADADLAATPSQITGEGTDSLNSIEQVELNGGAGNNRLDATAFLGGSRTALLSGGDGNDTLLGTPLNDTLNGGNGLDSLVGGNGIDLLQANGLPINSVIELTNGALQKRGGSLEILDQLQSVERAILASNPPGSIYNGTLLNASAFTLGPVTLIGSSGRDTLIGTTRGDSLDGGGGPDVIQVSGNVNFTVSNTQLIGRGADQIANVEVVEVTGGSGPNRIDASGFSGQTFLYGQGGNDTILGGSGIDTIFGGDGDDSIMAGASNDYLRGDAGNDTICGGEGNDAFIDASGDDSYHGEAGDDIFLDYTNVGVLDADTVDGGDGRDTQQFADNVVGTFVVTDSQVAITLPTMSGNVEMVNVDVVKLSGLSGLLDASSATTVSVFANGLSSNDTLIGGAGNDTLNGQSGDDSLLGGSGHDSLNGGDGNDTLLGGEGNNKLIGGNGDDSLIAGDGNDQLDGGLGTDTVDSGLGTDTLLGHEVGS